MRCAIRQAVVTFAVLPWFAEGTAWSQKSLDRGKSNRSQMADKVLGQARRFAHQRNFRAAEQLLLESLRRQHRETHAKAAWMAELGSVYADSGDFQSAELWLKRAGQKLDAASPSRATLGEQSAVALRLADVQVVVGKPPQAAETLRRQLAKYREPKIEDPARQLDLLVRLHELGETTLLADPRSPPLNREIERVAPNLRAKNEDHRRGFERLAEYRAATGNPAAAIDIIKRFANQSPCEASKRIAAVHRRGGDRAAEIAVLRSALDADRPPTQIPELELQRFYEHAELARMLADALAQDGDRDGAAGQWKAAQTAYQQALAIAPNVAVQDSAAETVEETALLERLVEVAGKLMELPGTKDRMPALAVYQTLLDKYLATLLSGDPRIFRLRVALAGLQMNVNRTGAAKNQLEIALDYWLKRQPVEYPMLGQTWNLLGEANLALGEIEQAQRCLDQAQSVCDEHLPEQELRLWIRINRGRLAMSRGQYRGALALFEDVLAANDHGRSSPRLRSAAWLHQGLLYKDLFQFDAAAELCGKALEECRRESGPEDVALLPHHLALGGLAVARRDAASLKETLESAAPLSAQLPDDDPARRSMAHLQAMVHYLRDEANSDPRERIAARACWEQLLPNCQGVDRARVLHYLARLDYLDWLAEWQAWRQRQSQQLDEHRAQEKLHSAQVDELRGRLKSHARRRLEYEQQLSDYRSAPSVALADRQREYDRLKTVHEDLTRRQNELQTLSEELTKKQASLLSVAQKALAQNQSLRDGQTPAWIDRLEAGEAREREAIALLAEPGGYPSLHYAALCNHAQMLQARAQLLAANGEQLAGQAIEALEQAIDLLETPRSNTVGRDTARAEFFAQYEAAFDLLVQYCVQRGDPLRALVAAERGRARNLLDQLRTADVAYRPAQLTDGTKLVERWQAACESVLYYYVGASASYLFVLGGPDARCEAFPLARPAAPGLDDILVSDREVAARVAELRAQLTDRDTARKLCTDTELRARTAQLSSILLPAAVQNYVRDERARGASHITVVPHGSISQLPLESLVPSANVGTAKFLVDMAPPLAYAPSLTVLDNLRDRRLQKARQPRVLTVGNPDYTAHNAAAKAEPLAPLAHSQAECERVARAFCRSPSGETGATLLTGRDATEGRLREEIAAHEFSCLHLAAHSTVADEQGQCFGQIVVTRPAQVVTAKDDGRLQLGEVYELDLSGCELTALSACSTSTGAILGQPSGDRLRTGSRRDASFSLASAFLAAGSSRVLATHWEVADDSTAELVARFFEKLTDRIAAGNTVNYASVFAETRREWRQQHPEQDTPFHWASLLLIGPAD